MKNETITTTMTRQWNEISSFERFLTFLWMETDFRINNQNNCRYFYVDINRGIATRGRNIEIVEYSALDSVRQQMINGRCYIRHETALMRRDSHYYNNRFYTFFSLRALNTICVSHWSIAYIILSWLLYDCVIFIVPWMSHHTGNN